MRIGFLIVPTEVLCPRSADKDVESDEEMGWALGSATLNKSQIHVTTLSQCLFVEPKPEALQGVDFNLQSSGRRIA